MDWTNITGLSERVLTAIVTHMEGEIVQTIQRKGLIQTGRLMGSIQGSVQNPHYAIVGANTDYAIYVEYMTGADGSNKSYLRYTLDMNRRDIKRIIREQSQEYFRQQR